jgi:hypothetical protein
MRSRHRLLVPTYLKSESSSSELAILWKGIAGMGSWRPHGPEGSIGKHSGAALKIYNMLKDDDIFDEINELPTKGSTWIEEVHHIRSVAGQSENLTCHLITCHWA